MKFDEQIDRSVYRSSDANLCGLMVECVKQLKREMGKPATINAVLEHLSVSQLVTVDTPVPSFLWLGYLFELNESTTLENIPSVVYRLCI
jgi:hypothetical protein